MATDKTIFELPDITLDILQSGVNISFVAQVEGYPIDFQVPADVLLQYVSGSYQIGISSGFSTPDNAMGANGDVYFKADGNIYQKKNGAWVIVGNIPLFATKVEFVILVGDALPRQISLPSTMQGGCIVQQWRCVDSDFRELAADALPKALMLNSPTTTPNIINRLDFAGYDDGTGHHMDPPLYYTISKA